MQMMPIGQCVSQDCDEYAFEEIIKWYQKQFASFLKPKSIAVLGNDQLKASAMSKVLVKLF